MKRYFLQSVIIILVFGLTIFSTHAELVMDGTMGTAGALKGPAYDIPSEYGQRAGNNLFHSFQTFNIGTKESATFRGPSSIQNVISRISGSTISRIDGKIVCTIPQANLYLLNPNGIMFGADATLDIGGSFHVSTADYLRLGNNERFYAKPIEGEVLSSAAPSAFGFLKDSPAPISFEGKGFIGTFDDEIQSGISVSESKTISVIGGDIDIKGTSYINRKQNADQTTQAGSLSAPGGRINLVSAASSGQAVMTDAAPDVSSFDKLGNIKISDFTMLSASGTETGSVFIRGGKFYAEQSVIKSDALGDNNGGVISIEADDISLKNRSNLYTDTFGKGNAGDILLSGHNGDFAKSFDISENSRIFSNTENKAATGNGGNISVKADKVNLNDFAEISSYSKTVGKGGNITIQATESVNISGSQMFASSEGRNADSGDAGSILIESKNFSLSSAVKKQGDTENKLDGIVSVDTDAGTGGSLVIRGLNGNAADSVTVSDASIFAGANGAGNAGRLFIEAKTIAFKNGGVVGSQSFDSGKGGDVYLHALDLLEFSGKNAKAKPSKVYTSSDGTEEPAGDAGNITIEADRVSFAEGTGITASTLGPGNAGAIKVTVNELNMDKGSITSSTDSKEKGGHAGTIDIIAPKSINMNNQSLISTATAGGGTAGDISVKTANLNVDNGSSISSASSSPPEYPGDAGRISIQANDSIYLGEGTSVTTEAINGGRGQIIINAGNMYRMESSKVTTTIKRGGNDAGDITINPPEWILMRDSKIVANAYKGKGGNIHLSSDHFVASAQSKVDASSELGIDGTVTIDSPDANISGGLIVLPTNFMDATRWMKIPCAQRSGASVSRFVIGGQDAIAMLFNDWQPSPAADLGNLDNIPIKLSYSIPLSLFDKLSADDDPCFCKTCNQ